MNTPLRDELKKLKFDHTDFGKDDDSGYNFLCDEDIDQILNLVASKTPEKKHTWDFPDLPTESRILAANSYNQGLKDSVKSILKGGTDE